MTRPGVFARLCRAVRAILANTLSSCQYLVWNFIRISIPQRARPRRPITLQTWATALKYLQRAHESNEREVCRNQPAAEI